MSYSCSDFTDDVLQKAVDLGWLSDSDIPDDDPGAQAALMISAMERAAKIMTRLTALVPTRHETDTAYSDDMRAGALARRKRKS